jgi:hypothetical protein
MFELAPAARLTVWANALFVGATSLDEAADRVGAGDPPHRVAGLPDEIQPMAVSMALSRLRRLGVTAMRLVLPVPGDASGLPGPASFNQLAVSAGGAVLCLGRAKLGLISEVRSSWSVCQTGPVPLPVVYLDDAERMLRRELRECTEDLLRLDVPRWQPVANRLEGDQRAVESALPPCYPAKAVRVLATAQRVEVILAAGRQTDGWAVTSSEMAKRQQIFTRLHTAARRATEAACNCVG